MQPMHGRLSDPGSCQGLQHFITHSTWQVRPFWQRSRSLLPVRRGVLAIDDTGPPKQGKFLVSVQRQYCGALGMASDYLGPWDQGPAGRAVRGRSRASREKPG